MNKIIIASPNPAIDKTTIIPNFIPGKIHRPQKVLAIPAGKGLNVARAVLRLGGEAQVFTILAGHRGRWVLEQMQAEGVPMCAAWGEGETRDCYSIIDPVNGLETDIFELAIPVSAQTWADFEQLVIHALPGAGMLACSGNLPPGAPLDGYGQLIRIAKQQGIRGFVDTYGEPLRLALEAQPEVLKVNGIEAGGLLGRTVETPQEALSAARELHHRGIPTVVITLGKSGAVGVDGSGAWLLTPPQVQTASATGSGDCFLAGLMVAMAQPTSGERGGSFPDALRLAAGAAIANVLVPGAGIFDPLAARELAEKVQLESL